MRAWLLVLLGLVAACEALRVPAASSLGRRAVIGTSAAALLLPRVSHAAGSGNSKDDKKYQECLSNCVYEATKITKGVAQVEVKSRTEAYAECKPKCALNKEQLMTGTPKAK